MPRNILFVFGRFFLLFVFGGFRERGSSPGHGGDGAEAQPLRHQETLSHMRARHPDDERSMEVNASC